MNDTTTLENKNPPQSVLPKGKIKEKLTRVCLMLNKRTIDKIAKVQAHKNFNTRTAAVVEIINAYE